MSSTNRADMVVFDLPDSANLAMDMYIHHARPVLASQLPAGTPRPTHLLLNDRGKPFEGATLTSFFKALQAQEGAPWVTDNEGTRYLDFRSGCAQALFSRLVADVGDEAQRSLQAGARVMGHTVRTQTDVYASNREGLLMAQAINGASARARRPGAVPPAAEPAISEGEPVSSSTTEEETESSGDEASGYRVRKRRRGRSQDSSLERSRERRRGRSQDSSRERSRERRRGRSQDSSRERSRERSRSRDGARGRGRSRERSRERSRGRDGARGQKGKRQQLKEAPPRTRAVEDAMMAYFPHLRDGNSGQRHR